MNRKKMLRHVLIFMVGAIIVSGCIWGIKFLLRERDPHRQAAKEIYEIQTALHRADENWELESLSEVRPYEIKRPD